MAAPQSSPIPLLPTHAEVLAPLRPTPLGIPVPRTPYMCTQLCWVCWALRQRVIKRHLGVLLGGTTIPHHNSCVVPLYHSTTVVWYHYTTPQQLCGTTLPLHNNTPYAPWSSALCLCGFGIVGNSSLEQQASPLTGKCTGAQHVLKCLANADMCSARADVYVVCTRSRAPWSCPPSRHALRL